MKSYSFLLFRMIDSTQLMKIQLLRISAAVIVKLKTLDNH